ncbi:MAG TPA: hypothetical protein V6C58_26350, partial [Allocoleopsis sp.]
MDVSLKIKLIEDSNHFKEFIKNNPHYYIVHIFKLLDDKTSKNNWQIGYYSKDTDRIVVFDYNEGIITVNEPEEALKEDNYIQKLDFNNIKISSDKALEISQELLEKEYKGEFPTKHIFLLQNLPEHGNIWNITIVTMTFSVINI